MIKQLLAFLIFFVSINTFAQDTFIPGYFVNNQGVKITCLIKDKDWLNTPDNFRYKLSETSTPQVASIETVKEIMVGDNYKWRRFTVQIDRPRQDPINLSSPRNPVFVEEQLFLKVLVEGNATLYSYMRNREDIYFYSVNGSEVEQLVYRVYNLGDNKLRYNTLYEQQLWNNLKCESINLPQISRTDYNANSLSRLFIEYNDCVDSPSIVYRKEKKKGSFNLKIRPGVNFNNLQVNKDGYYIYSDQIENQVYIKPVEVYQAYDFKPSLRVGLELEYILPVSNNKWAITLEPTYTHYETDAPLFLPARRRIEPNPIRVGTRPESVNIQYSTIELPLAVRYYMFLNDDSRLFLNSGISYNYHFSSSATEIFEGGLTRDRPDFEFNNNRLAFTAFAGFGFNYARYSIEGRYYPVKSALRNGDFRLNNNHGLALMVGYKLF